MLLNYIKLSLRLLVRNPFFTFINVLGLSVGFAVFFILWQYSIAELKTDQFQTDWKKIVRLTFEKDTRMGESWPGFTIRLANDLPELADFVRIYYQKEFNRNYVPDHNQQINLSYIDRRDNKITFKEEHLIYADPNLFAFFTLPLIEGHADDVLADPKSVVLSESMAKKYFGNGPALGQTLILNDSILLNVTGVFANLPHNTHLQFDAVLSTHRIEKTFNQILVTNGFAVTYFKIPENTDLLKLESKIDTERERHLAKIIGPRFHFHLQPLGEIAFSTLLVGDSFVPKSKYFLHLIQTIATVVLVMAWINYVNLSISAHHKRRKEMAARKTVGARAIDFNKQFVIEAFIINLFAICGAVTLIQLVKSPIELYLGLYLPPWDIISGNSIMIISLVLVTGILVTASYPALITLRRSPVNLFQASGLKLEKNGPGRWLTTLQLIMAIVLIVWIFEVWNQLDFILNKDLGLKKESVVVVDLPGISVTPHIGVNVFLKMLVGQPGISDASGTAAVLGDNYFPSAVIKTAENSPNVFLGTNGIDDRFIPLHQIKLIAGKNFQPGDSHSKKAIILTRQAVHHLGIPNERDAVGKIILIEAREWGGDYTPIEIIGVIEDYLSLPLLIGEAGGMNYAYEDGLGLTYWDYIHTSNFPRKVSISIDLSQADETIARIESVYSKVFPGSLFHWYFLDDNVNKHYSEEKVARNQMVVFALLAVGIACLGLLGMMANKIADKTKEIGIRKVLGAEIHQIAILLLGTTIKQIFAATLVGIPVAYLLTMRYLEKFSERIRPVWWHFTLPVLVLVLVMLITIASSLWKAARSNPVEALKYE